MKRSMLSDVRSGDKRNEVDELMQVIHMVDRNYKIQEGKRSCSSIFSNEASITDTAGKEAMMLIYKAYFTYLITWTTVTTLRTG